MTCDNTFFVWHSAGGELKVAGRNWRVAKVAIEEQKGTDVKENFRMVIQTPIFLFLFHTGSISKKKILLNNTSRRKPVHPSPCSGCPPK
jgi:hypothetical protein